MPLKDVLNPAVVNPLTFEDHKDQKAAVVARAQRIQDSSKFKALKPEHQQAVLGNYYDKYVTKAFGQGAPKKDVWTKGITQRSVVGNKFIADPGSFYESRPTEILDRLGNAAALDIGKMMHAATAAGVWVSKAELNATIGLNHFFSDATPEQNEKIKMRSDQILDHAKATVDKVSNNLINSSEFWLDSHPGKGFADSAASFVGDNLATLPLYEAIGAGRAGLGLGENLTKTLIKSKVGGFAARRLMEASDGFLGSLATDNDTKTAIKDGMAWGAVGGVFHGIGAARNSAIKAFTAKTMAMGGKPFVEAVEKEAEKELETGIHTSSNKMEEDPIKHKVVAAEKAVKQSMSAKLYNKAYKDLTKAEKAKVKIERAKLTEAAGNEMLAHVPEIAEHKAETKLKEQATTNPKLAARIAQAEKTTGLKVSAVLGQVTAKKVKEETGIISSQGAVKKIAKDLKKKDRDLVSSYDIARAVGKQHPEAAMAAEAMKKLVPQLPPTLAGSKPRYGYGSKNFQLAFQDNKDMAAHIVARKTKSKAHDDFMRYLRGHFNSDEEILAHGKKVQEYIKNKARDGDPREVLKVPRQ
jgi:hypothetical protein